jgi:hypothetical protein
MPEIQRGCQYSMKMPAAFWTALTALSDRLTTHGDRAVHLPRHLLLHRRQVTDSAAWRTEPTAHRLPGNDCTKKPGFISPRGSLPGYRLPGRRQCEQRSRGYRVGSFFQVDLDALENAVTTLQQVGDQMTSALRSMSSSGDGANIGNGNLNSAADSFQSTWQYGLGQIKTMVQQTNEGVGRAHDAYQQTDGAIQQAMTKINSAESQVSPGIDQLTRIGQGAR